VYTLILLLFFVGIKLISFLYTSFKVTNRIPTQARPADERLLLQATLVHVYQSCAHYVTVICQVGGVFFFNYPEFVQFYNKKKHKTNKTKIHFSVNFTNVKKYILPKLTGASAVCEAGQVIRVFHFSKTQSTI
jgi:hypothetical protein